MTRSLFNYLSHIFEIEIYSNLWRSTTQITEAQLNPFQPPSMDLPEAGADLGDLVFLLVNEGLSPPVEMVKT